MKKFLAILVAVMILAASMSALAADETYTITMTSKEGHTYQIYQVFTGTVGEDGKTLTAVKYGSSAKDGTPGAFLSPEDLAKLDTLKQLTDEQEIIAAYKDFVDFTKPVETKAQGSAFTAELAPGYYVIRDKDDTVPTDTPNDDITLYMFQVLNSNMSISAKSGSVESEKNINEGGTLTNIGDYDVGETINYELTFKLPENYDKYTKYKVVFNDTMASGLTYNGDARIYYGANDTEGVDIGSDFGSGTTLKYTIDDLKAGTDAQKALKAGDVITIKYTAYINETAAVYGNGGYKNTYYVDFSNNPNPGGEGKTGKTPDDTTVVFTYKTVFDKIDENGDALEGADFKLEKKVDGKWVDVTTLGDSAHPTKTGSSANKDTTFSFAGLDEGEYQLTEIFTPAGYNTIDPIVFTIESDLDSGELVVKGLTATSEKDEDFTMTLDSAKGTLSTSVMNLSGVVLPETGGIGTTIFYIGGSVLVLLAVVLLVTKRRMNAGK